MPRFTITVAYKGKHDTGHQWEESYDELVADPKEWTRKTITRFNATLRGGEKPRRLVRVAVFGPSTKHSWIKVSLSTVSDHLGMYDRMACENCEVTGKRFNLSPHIKIDSKYRAKKYKVCSGDKSREVKGQ